ncbi:helix-turn-helix domain-containing protein (plasmid) [Agrobacterium leguminum]|uniref:helix-turn-helix domain-containing protein n=1 Tax=Agrobacterium leguminum TaxID=2792015 RepID=UPI00272B8EB7|nr:helix-turn-helix domain-containing protein [Agrobacterium leguminum]WLE00746.1 helix-turn-helix domain-containing protein [Agrobacterium leguminum]
MTDRVPSFFVYGEPDRPLQVGFLHVETVMARKQLHSGRVSAHKHEEMAQITFWTSGRGEYFIEDRRLDFIAPAISFVPSGTVHGFTVEPETSDAIVISIADSALPPILMLSALPFEQPVMVRGQSGNPLWQRLGDTMNRIHDDYRQGLSQSLPALIAVATNDIASLASSDRDTAHGGNDLAQAFRRLVDLRFRENWPVERYVAELGTTPHLLTKACRDAHGLSVKAFVDERRLLEAKRLLLFTVRSVENVAYEVGFRDPAYFSRFFRLRTGEPPGEWRMAQNNRPA